MRSSTSKRYVPTLREQAVASRAMTFPNRKEEQEVLGHVDHEINKHLWRLERFLVEQAMSFHTNVTAVRAEADELRDELREMEFALEDGKDIDLDRWARADARVRDLEATAARMPRQYVGHADRLLDVLGYSEQLQSKYVHLHRPMVLPSARI